MSNITIFERAISGAGGLFDKRVNTPVLHCSGVDKSTTKKERATLSTRRLDFDPQTLHLLVDSCISTRRLDSIYSLTRWNRPVDSILSTHWINFIDSIVSTRWIDFMDSSTRLYRLIDSIVSTCRLDCIDSSTRLYRLIESILSTCRLDWTRWLDCIDSIVLTRRLDCTESLTWLYRLVNSILSTCRPSDIDSSNRLNDESTNQCNGFGPNTIESMKQCGWVDGMIQRSRLIVNHKCKKNLWVNRVDESMSRRVDGQKRASDRVDGTMQ